MSNIGTQKFENVLHLISELYLSRILEIEINQGVYALNLSFNDINYDLSLYLTTNDLLKSNITYWLYRIEMNESVKHILMFEQYNKTIISYLKEEELLKELDKLETILLEIKLKNV